MKAFSLQMSIPTAMKKIEKRQGSSPKGDTRSTGLNGHGEIKPDYPLIEKDEVKQAEERMRRALKKHG